MRKFFIVIFVFVTTSIAAQSLLEKPEVYVGFSGGATASMLLFSPSVDQQFLYGYNTGIAFRYIAEKNVGIQAELNYSQRGWRESSGAYTRQLNYIELPFLTHIYIGNKTQFIINLGPKISYLLSENVIKNSTTDTDTQHVTRIQNSFDYGLCAGFGILFNAHKSVFQLDSRVNYGLSDVFSNDKRDFFDASNNLNISLNLAYYFQVK
jgi:hypothetical protein